MREDVVEGALAGKKSRGGNTRSVPRDTVAPVWRVGEE